MTTASTNPMIGKITKVALGLVPEVLGSVDVDAIVNNRLLTAPVDVYVTLLAIYFCLNRMLSAGMPSGGPGPVQSALIVLCPLTSHAKPASHMRWRS